MQSNSEKFWNIPNIITFSRILLALLVIILLWFLEAYKNNYYANIILSWTAAIFFIIASISDYVDGYLARKYKIITDFGKLLDPIADKILVISAIIMLIPLNRIAAWMAVILISREITVTGIRAIAASEGVIISASSGGKLKTILLSIALGALLIFHPINILGIIIDAKLIGNVTLWLAFIVSLWSGASYSKNFIDEIAKK